jgi:hypothetical protein
MEPRHDQDCLGRIAKRMTSASNSFEPNPASTTTVVPFIPLLRSLKRNSAAFATSAVAIARYRNVNFSA